MDKKNNPELEVAWAIKTHTHAETYFKLISAFDASKLKLTNYDDDIYRQFKRYFRTLEVKVIKEEEFKSEIAKARWRPFCNLFKNKVEDYNFGTLLRIDCDKGYNDENTILGAQPMRKELNVYFWNKSQQTPFQWDFFSDKNPVSGSGDST